MRLAVAALAAAGLMPAADQLPDDGECVLYITETEGHTTLNSPDVEVVDDMRVAFSCGITVDKAELFRWEPTDDEIERLYVIFGRYLEAAG